MNCRPGKPGDTKVPQKGKARARWWYGMSNDPSAVIFWDNVEMKAGGTGVG